MKTYVDILLLENGVFCMAPAWGVNVDDMVSLTDAVGNTKILKVLATATDSADGDFVKLTEKYISYPLPKIIGVYKGVPADWGEEEQK